MRRAAAVGVLACVAAGACGETLPIAADDADASLDAAVADGGTSSDASECRFSDDFERPPADVARGWSVNVTEEGLVTIVDGAFQAQTPASDGLVARTALLAKELASPPTTLRCTFDFRIDSPTDPDRHVDAFYLEIQATDGTLAELRLDIERDGIDVREDLVATDASCQCPVSEKKLDASIEPGTWSRISFETNYAEVFVNRNGELIGTHTFPAITPAKVIIYLGALNFSTAAATRSFDNVVCDLGC